MEYQPGLFGWGLRQPAKPVEAGRSGSVEVPRPEPPGPATPTTPTTPPEPPDPVSAPETPEPPSAAGRRGRLVTARAADINRNPLGFQLEWRAGPARWMPPADPLFSAGRRVDLAQGARPSCELDIPYPAAGPGAWILRCRTCIIGAWLPASGQADDPRRVEIACRHLRTK